MVGQLLIDRFMHAVIHVRVHVMLTPCAPMRIPTLVIAKAGVAECMAPRVAPIPKP